MTAPKMVAPRRSFVDRALAVVGLARASTRQAPRASVFRGAEFGRLTQDWFSRILSADQEIKSDFRRLRGVARALVRDNAFASRYVHLLAENVVGPNGILLQAQAKNTRGTLNLALNQKIEDAWAEWSRPENASVDGRLSWVDLQTLAVQSLPQDGEVLIRIVRGADNPFHFALQLLDPDLLDHEYTIYAGSSPTGNDIIMGVEVDRWFKPVAYWLWTSHPSDPIRNRKRERVSADEIIHLYRVRRPGQTRGVTWFAPVMFDTEMLQGYQEAEITAARIGASNMAAVTYDPEKGVGEIDGDLGDPAVRDGLPMEVEPGRFLHLNPGEGLVSTDFNHPSSAFDPFTKAIQRSQATGLNVAYSSLTGDLTAVNYSSIRAGLVAERDFYRSEQRWLISALHERVYRAWAPYAALGGYFSAAEARGTEKIVWQPRGWKWVDPLNDAQAAIMMRKSGLTSLTKLCAEQGIDFEENLEEIARENALAKTLGVVLEETGAKPAKVTPGREPQDPADTKDAPDGTVGKPAGVAPSLHLATG